MIYNVIKKISIPKKRENKTKRNTFGMAPQI